MASTTSNQNDKIPLLEGDDPRGAQDLEPHFTFFEVLVGQSVPVEWTKLSKLLMIILSSV